MPLSRVQSALSTMEEMPSSQSTATAGSSPRATPRDGGPHPSPAARRLETRARRSRLTMTCCVAKCIVAMLFAAALLPPAPASSPDPRALFEAVLAAEGFGDGSDDAVMADSDPAAPLGGGGGGRADGRA